MVWKAGKIFGCDEERNALLEYTKKAIDFASNIGCENLVFGCLRNRNLPDDADESVAVVFLKNWGIMLIAKVPLLVWKQIRQSTIQIL